MSSILDALRKVEAETTKEKVDLGEVENFLAEKDLLVPEEIKEERKARRVNRAAIVVAVVVAVALFGAAGFFLYGKLTSSPQAGVTDNRIDGLVPAQNVRPPATEEPSAPISSSPAAESEIAAPVIAPALESTVVEPTIAEGNVSDSPPASANPEASAAAAPAPAQRPALKINVLRPSSVQFPDALAVVNRQRVAVGESVDGAKVLEIRVEGILFEYAGESFFVRF